jgi:hypothetical protein
MGEGKDVPSSLTSTTAIFSLRLRLSVPCLSSISLNSPADTLGRLAIVTCDASDKDMMLRAIQGVGIWVPNVRLRVGYGCGQWVMIFGVVRELRERCRAIEMEGSW